MSDNNKAQDETARPVVLVLDDEQAYTKVMSMVLDEYGFDPVPANSAEDAWELLDRATPDLVLLDVMMPKIDGITFLGELRERAELRTVPVLVVTAYTETREKAMSAGASGYLKKPFSAQQLRDSIGEFLSVENPEDPLFK
jgi:DNA-binding response OmpR family regulator